MLLTPSLAVAQQSGSGAVPGGATGAIIKPPEPQPEAKQPVVVMPEIVHFENAPYPPEAEKAGLQANVVLKLTVDKEGNVTAADVVEPVGNGFDEAAQAAALKFKFKPATRDGVPFAVKIKYSYAFTLTPVENAPPPPPPTHGEVDGFLFIAGTEAPLAGAEIIFVGPDGKQLRVTTDGAGAFKLPQLLPGKYKLKISADGYDPFESDEDVVAGEATEVKYRLAPVSEGLEITVKGERPPREVTRRTLERREINRIPGTSGDALRSLQSLPGVARPPGLAGLLIVRGSAPEGTAYFVDGSDVPLIYHFGGLSSVVPTELLDQIDFYPGNFSAKYGRKMGGVVDVALRKPDTKCYGDYGKPTDKTGCYHAMAQADLIDLRTMVQGPIPGTKNWSFAAAGRYSWFDKWLKPALEAAGSSVTSAPVYSDYQVIAEHNTGESRTSLRMFGADDRFEVIITDPAAQDPVFGGSLRFGESFIRGQILNEAKLSQAVDLTSMVSIGRDQVHFGLGILRFDLDLHPIYWREELSAKVAKGVKLNAGMDFAMSPFKVLVRAPLPPRPGEPDPGRFASRPVLESQSSGFGFRPAWYVEGELTPLDRLRVVPGVRLDFARDSGHADFSPRINARYDLVKGVGAEPGAGVAFTRRTSIKGGAGVYNQPPEYQETDKVFGTPNIESNRSVHYSLGVEQELTRHVELSVEGFYKDLTNQVARTPTASGYTYNNLGTGSVKGIETLLKFKPDDRFFGWIAYTVSRSVRKDFPGGDEYLFQYDQTHNLIVLGSYRLGRGWEFGARFRVVSGPLDTPVVGPPSLPAIYAADAGSYVALQGKPYTSRLPLFHQLDLRVDKRWQFKSWALSTYLDVQNVYNHPAAESFVYNFDYSRRSYQTGIPIIPSIGLRGEL